MSRTSGHAIPWHHHGPASPDAPPGRPRPQRQRHRHCSCQSASGPARGGEASLVGGLMDDVMALLASLPGRFSALRSTQNQRRLRGDAATRLEKS
ncbi:hypothetical protein FXW78_47965 [Rhodococcus opacus]|nr:hypothetical protein [Rhodococcus opacus]